MQSKWRIAVDTGGTFTDCTGVDPSGKAHQAKVLSSSCLRGQVVETEPGARLLKVSDIPSMNPGFFKGFSIRIGDWSSPVLDSASGDGEESACTFTVGKALPDELKTGALVSLGTGEEAPILGIRMMTGTAPADEFPPLDLRLGSTRGTNALLEEKGDPPLLIMNEGFKDLLRIRDQRRPDLFALQVETPNPLHGPVLEVGGRLDRDGKEVETLDPETIRKPAGDFLKKGITNAVVALMHSYRNPAHEESVVALLRELGYEYVTFSAEASPFIHYLSRSETAVVDAYLGPLMEAYLDAVETPLQRRGQFRIMTSAGGLSSRRSFYPRDSLLSGPAGGVVGVAAVGKRMGRNRMLALDMGGTSTDVSRYDGAHAYVETHSVGRARLASPALRIETVAAGGGSICGFDGNLLTVGPESAGAEPGPACYGAGGPLTLTDVNLLLGRFTAEKMEIPLFEGEARKAFARIHRQIEERTGKSMGERELLEGFLDLANERMAQAMNRISVREGFDPSDFTLVAFGGAGGQHACAIADKLGICEIVAPAESGILSAYGISKASLEVQRGEQIFRLWKDFKSSCASRLDHLEEKAKSALKREGWDGGEALVVERELYLRLEGQDLEIAVSADEKSIGDAFTKAFKSIFGYFPPGREIEVSRVRIRVRVRDEALEKEDFKPEKSGAEEKTRCIAEDFFTLVVEPGWRVYRSKHGSIQLRREMDIDDGECTNFTRPDVIGKTLMTQRLRNLVEEMGTQLRRTALSTNIKERLDYSCALLDSQGRLIVNAPHIPVHLGALGVCVRRVSEDIEWRPGDMIIVNHPHFGGSHLPDITMITPLFTGDEGENWRLSGFLANRAHHAEIGGILPGSMPPHAKTLAEEGVVIPPTYLYKKGVGNWERIRMLLGSGPYPSRQVEENCADLHAQVASLRKGRDTFEGLVRAVGADMLESHMTFLRNLAREAVTGPLDKRITRGVEAVEFLDDGSRLSVKIQTGDGRPTLDFSGTSPVHAGNMNATPAIVHSVVLYTLRLMVGKQGDLPLNEGFLDGLEIVLPECLLNPTFPRDPRRCPAVVGGNVEVSQRLADTLIKALGLSACSQGTMNNIIFGNDAFSHYETLGGGSGAGPGWDGAGGTHVHMSNTAITDAEILEFRFPVRLREFSLRKGSGGVGKFQGGEGLVRIYEFLERLAVSLLSQHRNSGPFGCEGGAPGKPGRQFFLRPGNEPVGLDFAAHLNMEPGDRLHVETPGGGGWGAKNE